MDNSTDKKKGMSFRTFVVLAAAVTGAALLFSPSKGIISMLRASSEIKRNRAMIEQYRHDTEQMQRKIDQLKSNPDTLEKFAREQFLFAAPGDDVYVIDR